MKAGTAPPQRWLERPVADLRALEPGEHVCCLYRDDHERQRVAGGFARQALAAGERLIYISRDRTIPQAVSLLEGEGVATDLPRHSGQLVMVDFDEVYGPLEAAGPAAVVTQFRRAAETCRADGFPGLRVATEMGDVASTLGPFEHLLRWERTTSRAQGEMGITTICQYDNSKLAPSQAKLLAAEHTSVATSGAPPPLASFLATTEPWGLKVVGDVDLSNRATFLRALRARLAGRTELCLDLAELRFIDVTSLGGIYEEASKLPPGCRLCLRNVPELVHRVLAIAGFGPGHVEMCS